MSTADGVEHLVLTHGDIKEVALGSSGLLTRIHSECLTGISFDPADAIVATSSTQRSRPSSRKRSVC
ncbi:hypothetical protein FXW78_24750 [Rhodococcus opacus]|nr:hypothetical protein [Rhodococcus opacus]